MAGRCPQRSPGYWLASIRNPGCFVTRAALAGLLILLQACATAPQRLDAQALAFGFLPVSLNGQGYRLSCFYKNAQAPAQPLHVYLEGDGQPWASRFRIATDPTPRNPLMLRLMALDPGPSLYLARPCYNGHAGDRGCGARLWTQRRYAPEVVASMADGLREFLRGNPHEQLVFMGHSGGGGLALLLAGEFPGTRAVVTLAGNLEIDRWADYHGYTRLLGSLNPGDTRFSQFPEFHYLGEGDSQIPAALLLPSLGKRRNAEVIRVPDADHVCCWEKLWPGILRSLSERLQVSKVGFSPTEHATPEAE